MESKLVSEGGRELKSLLNFLLIRRSDKLFRGGEKLVRKGYPMG